jgi:peptide deformylase
MSSPTVMKIITVPHPTLRSVAQPVTQVDTKLVNFLQNLDATLAHKRNPKGVGLAAPQVNTKWRIFSTQLTTMEGENETTRLRSYINPEIIDHSDELTVGAEKENPTLEGCLSIPGIYGPIPRWSWVKLRYEKIGSNNALEQQEETFRDFSARVIQHEIDHLDGILFIDHTIKYGLPLYKENPKNDKLYEIDEELIDALVRQTQVKE